MKPYRWISHSELVDLQHHFSHSLDKWNEQYALHPLSCELSPPSAPETLTQSLKHENQQLARVEPSYFPMISYATVGESSDCFSQISETLGLELLNQLLGCTLQRHQDTLTLDDWIYKGSPALNLTLLCGEQSALLYLHPKWVSNALHQQQKTTPKPLVFIHDALESQPLALHVELTSLSLRVADLTNLRVGDVIQTEHLTHAALFLKHDQTTICNVHLGKTNVNQSIQIPRTP